MKKTNQNLFWTACFFCAAIVIFIVIFVALSVNAKPVRAKMGDWEDAIQITEIVNIKDGETFDALIPCCDGKIKVVIKIELHGIKIPKFKTGDGKQNKMALGAQKRLGWYLLHYAKEIRIKVEEKREDGREIFVSKLFIKNKNGVWVFVNESLINDDIAQPDIPEIKSPLIKNLSERPAELSGSFIIYRVKQRGPYYP